MKDKILELLRQYPNMNKRELSSYLRTRIIDLLDPLNELVKSGQVRETANTDHANGEYYTMYSIIE